MIDLNTFCQPQQSSPYKSVVSGCPLHVQVHIITEDIFLCFFNSSYFPKTYIVHLFPRMCRIKQYGCLRWISYSMAATCCSFSSFPPPIPKKITSRGAVVMLKFPFGRAETCCPSRLTAVKTGNRCCWDHTGSKSIIKFRYKRECHLCTIQIIVNLTDFEVLGCLHNNIPCLTADLLKNFK